MHSSRSSAPSQNYYQEALDAAKISVDAFRAVLEKPGAAAIIRNYASYNHDIFIALLETIPDEKLPPLLEILIKHQVHIVNNGAKSPPLEKAASFGKTLALKCLLANNFVTNPQQYSFFVAVIPYSLTAEMLPARVQLINMLVEDQHIDVDVIDEHGHTALHRAAKKSLAPIISCLLSKGAKHARAFAVAYNNYFDNDCDDRFSESSLTDKNCLDLLINAAYQYFFKKTEFAFYHLEKRLDTFLDEYMAELKIECEYHSDKDQRLENIKHYLREHVVNRAHKDILQSRMERDQRFYFCNGALKPQGEEKAPPIYKDFFAHPLFDRNLVKTIFSYTHHIPSSAITVNEIDENKSRLG
jgi:hypothetical protein